MKFYLITTILLIVFLFMGCRKIYSQNEYVLSATEFAQKMQEIDSYQLIDVRTPEEFSEGYLQHSLNIDWKGAGFEEQLGLLDQSKPVFTYCRSGRRSIAAANKMRSKGFEVYELRGGILEWKESGLPIIVEN